MVDIFYKIIGYNLMNVRNEKSIKNILEWLSLRFLLLKNEFIEIL